MFGRWYNSEKMKEVNLIKQWTSFDKQLQNIVEESEGPELSPLISQLSSFLVPELKLTSHFSLFLVSSFLHSIIISQAETFVQLFTTTTHKKIKLFN